MAAGARAQGSRRACPNGTPPQKKKGKGKGKGKSRGKGKPPKGFCYDLFYNGLCRRGQHCRYLHTHPKVPFEGYGFFDDDFSDLSES